MQKFIGAINLFGNHIPQLAQMAEPLYKLLSSKHKFSFKEVNRLLEQRIPLQPADLSQAFTLTKDASGTAIGAVLTQNGGIVGHFSRTLSPSEKNYSTFDREALAIVDALKNYKHLLVESAVTIKTDHKPLVGWLENWISPSDT